MCIRDRHGNGGGEAFQELQAQPGVARMAGAGGNAHGLQLRAGRQVQNARIVISLFLKPILSEIENFHAIIKTSNVKERIWFYQRNGHVM